MIEISNKISIQDLSSFLAFIIAGIALFISIKVYLYNKKKDKEDKKEHITNLTRFIYEDLKYIRDNYYDKIIKYKDIKPSNNEAPFYYQYAKIIISISNNYSITNDIKDINNELLSPIISIYNKLSYYKQLADRYFSKIIERLDKGKTFPDEHDNIVSLFINLNDELIPALEKELGIKDSNLTDKI